MQLGLIGVQLGLIGVQLGLIGVQLGLIGVQLGLIGVQLGLIGVQLGLIGVQFGHIAMHFPQNCTQLASSSVLQASFHTWTFNCFTCFQLSDQIILVWACRNELNHQTLWV